MTERQISREEFNANGGAHNPLQHSTGCPVVGNLKFWTRAR